MMSMTDYRKSAITAMLWDGDGSNHDQGCLETVTWCGTHPCTQESAPIPLSALFSQRSASDGSERTAVTFRFGRFLFFFSPSSLLPSMHPSSFEGTRGRVRARAGHDRRTNSDDRHLLFLSPALPSPLISLRSLAACLEFAIFKSSVSV